VNLRELVKSQKGHRSYATLADDCGGYPSDKRLQQLATQQQKNFVDPKTIQALARGLRVTEVTVVLAAAEDLGLDVSRATPRVLDYLPAAVNDLDEDQLFAIGNLIRSFIPPEQQDDPTPAEIALASEVTRHIGTAPELSEADDSLSEAALHTTPGVDQEPGETEE
jgi:hypothetical protein